MSRTLQVRSATRRVQLPGHRLRRDIAGCVPTETISLLRLGPAKVPKGCHADGLGIHGPDYADRGFAGRTNRARRVGRAAIRYPHDLGVV